ncbi:hypothetical protein P8625_11120 [Tenacibaculum tangerinum]|uniref:Lipocalin-like domain-containing protein n=1 Tax=Tenacibaculum tangerinum TaxID=3038772 RepID=A0ABY8KZI2_9FLAO|nr:hypothetical protein [Tenacibaculum tangerinum]WGH74637.1 hypothetical protein P8625_11120 [Tenacibaculum tangerinum]
MKNIFLILLLALISCNEDETKSQETIILGNWKLTSIVNESNGSILVPNDFLNSNEITITFNQELDFTGNTVINNFSGNYSINQKEELLTFLNFSTTEVNETEWGNLFYQSLNSNYNEQTENWENPYEIAQGNILKIFYSEQEYMTFEKQ